MILAACWMLSSGLASFTSPVMHSATFIAVSDCLERAPIAPERGNGVCVGAFRRRRHTDAHGNVF
jgi:hypothetical protein